LECSVTLYAIFDPRSGRPGLPAAVPEKFSWLAAFLPPVFFLLHGLWLELIGFVLAVVVLIVGARYIGGGATFSLYVLGVVWLGFAASGLRRHALAWRGWTHRGERVAPSAELAQLEALQ